MSLSPRRRTSMIDALESRRLLATYNFNIDSNASFLKVSVNADVEGAGDVDLDPQADGLDTARLEGTLSASVSRTGVRFYGGNSIRLIDRPGEYSPGDAPAAWAFDGEIEEFITLAEVDAAFRDVALDVSNSSRGRLDRRTKLFDIRNGNVEVTAGTLDYQLDSPVGDADGSESLAGLESSLPRLRGKLTGGPGDRAITVPINVTLERDIDGATVEFTITGRVVGREAGAAQAAVAQAASFSTQRIDRYDASDDVLG